MGILPKSHILCGRHIVFSMIMNYNSFAMCDSHEPHGVHDFPANGGEVISVEAGGEMPMEEKNLEKQSIYADLKTKLTRAMRAKFYYEAIFIEYAIVEDRCRSVLHHAGLPYQNKSGEDISLSKKLNKIESGLPAFASDYVKKRLTPEFIREIRTWKDRRDNLTHKRADVRYGHEDIEEIAVAGREIVRVLENKVKSVNNYFDKMKEATEL